MQILPLEVFMQLCHDLPGVLGTLNRISYGPNLEMRRDAMSKGRVLVVDDEADVRASVRLILSKAEYEVIEAEDGQAAVNALKPGGNPIAVDAIICDLDMPKMDGIEAIPNFLFGFPSCPIIILSGSEKLESAARLFQPGVMFKQGVKEFLSKPIDQGMLLKAVEKVVNESGRRDQIST
jgi:two-component system chemotaxis response regulator CheY